MTTEKKEKKVALVTGAAGFIGYHISKRLLDEGLRVIGVDSLSDYYDITLKKNRESLLLKSSSYRSIHNKVESPDVLMNIFAEERPQIVIHLAAQVGVRNSINNPRPYLNSNIIGTFELLEAARKYPPEHMMLASTSSTYGANVEMPYNEKVKTDHQMSFYAATKKSTESIAHYYSHLFKLHITMMRFFTVYGPWGRPDMAMFKFTKSILNGDVIELYNHGNLTRDFTYINDVVNGMRLLIDVRPVRDSIYKKITPNFDNISPVAPFRIVNIGNSKPKKLIDFIQAIEIATNTEAKLKLISMQPGDVYATWSDTSLLEELTGYHPKTSIKEGVENFVRWYCQYYRV